MQMMRAKCVGCHWVFDVVTIPGPVLDVAKVCRRRCVCPICYADGAVIADPRMLTPDEIAAKGLGPLGTSSAPPAPAPAPPPRKHTAEDEAAFLKRYEADYAANMGADAWGDWVDALPRNEFLAMLSLGIKDKQEARDGA